ETNVVPFGIGSDTDTSVSSVGPLFVTTIVQVIALPVVTGFGLPVFVIARSVTGDGGGGFFAFVNVHTIASPGPTDTAPPANTCTGSLFAAAFTQESEAVNPETAVSLTKYIPGTTICVPVVSSPVTVFWATSCVPWSVPIDRVVVLVPPSQCLRS